MINNNTIAVVVPAYNEEKQIRMVIDTMPEYVDRIIVVNDASKDGTLGILKQYIDQEDGDFSNVNIGLREVQPTFYNASEIYLQELDRKEESLFNPSELINTNPDTSRLIVINHLKNGGVGAAISTGYKWCKNNNIDCIAVMAGDGQMDPDELERICRPVIEEGIDYAKGNRLIHRSAKYLIPGKRYIGNSILSILTKIASGYWRISDTQTGFTAISLNALKKIDIGRIYKKYGMPNDILVKLNLAKCSVKEVEIKPIYRVGEQSKMKIVKVIPRVSWLLLKSFFKRIWNRYFLKDFHPLFLLYNLAFLLFIISIPFLVKILSYVFVPGVATPNSILMIFIFLVISGLQSMFFAMWMDIQDNDRLQK
ncbi:glycosyltransferase family 2 protein [Bacteroidota bacterium]